MTLYSPAATPPRGLLMLKWRWNSERPAMSGMKAARPPPGRSSHVTAGGSTLEPEKLENNLANFKSLIQYLAKNYLLMRINYAIGQFFIVVNGKSWKIIYPTGHTAALCIVRTSCLLYYLSEKWHLLALVVLYGFTEYDFYLHPYWTFLVLHPVNPHFRVHVVVE